MGQLWLTLASRAYSGLVIATTIFSASVIAWCDILYPLRENGWDYQQAEIICVQSSLLSSIVGGTMGIGCLWFGVAPPVLIVRRMQMAILLFLLNLMLLMRHMNVA